MNVLLVLLLNLAAVTGDPTSAPALSQPRAIVTQIQRADYAGDRAALQQLRQSLAPYVDDKEIGTRVLYWQGFASWRRALNGFNDHADPKELEQDLRQAISDFQTAYTRDPNFSDAKIGAASCLTNLLYLHLKEPNAVEQYSAQFRPLFGDVQASDPDNPRFLWIKGAALWYMPANMGGGPAQAIATYASGLQIIHHQQTKSSPTKSNDPLNPSWGEPELLMNLAWSNLNKPKPDLEAAAEYANAALALVPDWHYVRDLLIPQIKSAKEKASVARAEKEHHP